MQAVQDAKAAEWEERIYTELNKFNAREIEVVDFKKPVTGVVGYEDVLAAAGGSPMCLNFIGCPPSK